MKKTVLLLILCFLLLGSSTASADFDEGLITIGDLVISRPVGIAITAVGSAVFIVSLPFALTSGSVKETADLLVGDPFRFTFKRPLGDFKQYGAFVSHEKKQTEQGSAGQQKQDE